MPRYILLLSCLLFVPPGQTATVYKFIDANGAVAYTDEPPAHGSYEVVELAPPAPSSSLAEAQARQASLQAANDKMATARKQRDQARQQGRVKPPAVAAQYPPYPLTYSEPAPLYYGYPYHRGRGHFHRPHHNDRPINQTDPPPVRRRLPTVPVIPR